MIETVSAFEARRKFGELINKVAYGRSRVIVERRGVPLVEIKAVMEEEPKSYLGIWAGKEGEKIAEGIASFRKKFKPHRIITL